MASSSSSSFSFKYDVFLSFRGEDTRLGFTGNLYNTLIQSGIRTFIEGEQLHTLPTILKAIDESMIALLVFSENYASSRLCLDQLVKITECREKKGMIVMPIFYDIDPFHVRHQTGSYGEAFSKYERYEVNKDKVRKWRMALREVANMSGWDFRNGSGYQYEYEFIRKIVKDVSNKIVLALSNYPVEYENDFIGKIAEEFSNKINGAPLHAESQLPEINLLLDGSNNDDSLHMTSKRILEAQVRVWRLVGLVSSIVGLSCYAFSPSFTRLIRGWNPLKMVLFGVLAFVIWATILFAKQHPFSRQGNLTAIMGFLAFMLTNVYSFYFDKAMSGKPDILSLVSNVAFAFTSLSFSRVFKIGSDFGILSCFQALLTAQLMAIHFLLILVAIVIGCPLYIMHFNLVSKSEVGNARKDIHSSFDSRPRVGIGGDRAIHSSSTSQPAEIDSGGQHILSSSNSQPAEVVNGGQHILSSTSQPEEAVNGGQHILSSSNSQQAEVGGRDEHFIDLDPLS